MAETLAAGLEELDWPLETSASFEIRDSGRTASLDVDLPEIEDLPEIRAQLSKTGKRLLIKKRSQTDQRRLYARHIHGIALRLLGEVFACLPTVEEAFVSGFSQRLDPGTGRRLDEYLVSVRATREMLARIDFSALGQVDPVEAIGGFDCQRKMTKTGVFRAIEPIDMAEADP